MPDIFLSYSRDDQATAKRFAEAFEREGLSVWWDQTLKPGEAFDEVTEHALNEAKAVVVLWSKTSVASRWVRAEATQANGNKTLLPVMIEACKRPIMFELTHTADLSQWKGDANDATWRAFATDVRQFVRKESREPAATLPAMPGARRIGASGIVIAALALLLIAGAAIWAISRSHMGANPVTAASVTPTPAMQVTLAVLPFADMSTTHDQESFSDGLTEEILNQLAQIKAMRVTGRTSSFSFKGKNEDLRSIAEKLGVGNLLEGSIRKDGNQLRITAQLINGKDGAHLWSQTYDRELSGIFALQEEIAKDVAKALSITLDVGDLPRAQGGTTNIEAYDKFLRASALADLPGPAESARSIQLYREAVALDPGFARAWYGLHGVLEFTMVVPDPEKVVETRKEMADASARVVALAPDAWWTQTMLAEQFRLDNKWAEGAAAVSKAVALAPPSEISVTTAYVLFLWATGRAKDAATYMQRSHEVNPLSRTDWTFLQLSLDLAGRPDEAQAEYERARLALGESNAILDMYALLRLLALDSAGPAAIKEQFRLAARSGIHTGTLEQTLADNLENKDAARAALRQAFERSISQNEAFPFGIAEYADHFGDRDLALTALRHGLIDLHGLTLHQLWLPSETGFRTDPRFKVLLRDLGLADYFRASGNWGDFCKPAGKDDFECH